MTEPTVRRSRLLLALLLLCALSAAQAAEPLPFTILHSNDEHSTLLPSPLVDYHPERPNPSRGGFARLAQAVAELRAEKAAVDEPVLLLSAGDFLGGSAFAWLSLQGLAPELSLMQEIGYDVITIGNHEFDYGPERLAQYLAAAGYPKAGADTVIVASNMRPPAGHPLFELGIRQTHLQELDNGLTVGFFGLLGRHAVGVTPLAAPVEFADQLEVAKAAARSLRAAGADVVVAITHSGTIEDRELAERVAGIDVIVGGHSHEALYEPILHADTIIVQAGELLEYLGVLELAYDPVSGRVSVRNGPERPHLLALDDSVPAHPAIAARVAEYTEALNAAVGELTDGLVTRVDQVVASAPFSLPNRPRFAESPLGNFVTDAMRFAVEQATGEPVDFAFQANGIIRGTLSPGATAESAGQIAFLDLVELVGLGFGPDGGPGYPLISVYLTGEEVRRILELSILLSELKGNNYYLQPSGLRMAYDRRRAVLATLPIVNTPIPTTRAVLSAERYTGRPWVEPGEYLPLGRNDDTLYHVVTDHYLAAFMPMIGDLLPSLGLQLKDRAGRPIEPDQAIVYRDGRELKVWQAVVEYAAAQPADAAGRPAIAAHYAGVGGRLEQRDSVPLLAYPLAGLVMLLGLVALLWGWRAWR